MYKTEIIEDVIVLLTQIPGDKFLSLIINDKTLLTDSDTINYKVTRDTECVLGRLKVLLKDLNLDNKIMVYIAKVISLLDTDDITIISNGIGFKTPANVEGLSAKGTGQPKTFRSSAQQVVLAQSAFAGHGTPVSAKSVKKPAPSGKRQTPPSVKKPAPAPAPASVKQAAQPPASEKRPSATPAPLGKGSKNRSSKKEETSAAEIEFSKAPPQNIINPLFVVDEEEEL